LKLLLDTHTYIWWLSRDRRLPPRARAAIESSATAVYVSAAVIWEAEIKIALGKLRLSADLDLVTEIAASGFLELPIQPRHAQHAANLPPHHHDPFDRVLIAQAKIEGMILATSDAVFGAYGIPLL
jgi:PIN domain nuclease of toxin-antitoxin system